MDAARICIPELPVYRIERLSDTTLVTLKLSLTPFNTDEVDTIRPGAIFLCRVPNDRPVLGVVRTGNRDYIESKHSFVVAFFSPDDEKFDAMQKYTLIYVTQFITEFRCYEALTTKYTIHFVSQLLGHPVADVHEDLLFYRSFQQLSVCEKPSTLIPNTDVIESSNISDYFHVPMLNDAQNEAAHTFLTSEPNTITLVQGPPGTGKTTLLVSILCRYCMKSLPKEENDRTPGCRILVSAPTNKAVSVLATRFLKALKEESNVNVILIGDADKLLSGDGGRKARPSSDSNHQKKKPRSQGPLKSIFVYTWMDMIIDGYFRIRSFSLSTYKGDDSIATLLPLARHLRQELKRRLPNLLQYSLLQRMDETVDELESQKISTKRVPSDKMVKLMDIQIKELKNLKSDDVIDQLLESAHVIFCTLASAGGALIKKMTGIDDLIVDEAAAATEPELYIPFHMEPKRLLVVGDPLQLPATVMSPRAMDLGLAKSLHERLMYDCKYKHIMLDVQYRMHPDISAFPSARFYDGKIGNGPNVISSNYAKGAILLNRQPYTFLQVDGQDEQLKSGSYQNIVEAEIIVEIIIMLRQMTLHSLSDEWCGSDRIRVITFYQGQVACIEQCLKERGLRNTVLVATVDSSQGCEADIVLISFVRSHAGTGTIRKDRPPSAGFLKDDRRMNVALTRAKYQLICVGNVRSFHRMSNAPTLHLLAKNADTRGIIHMPPPVRRFDQSSVVPTFHRAKMKPNRQYRK